MRIRILNTVLKIKTVKPYIKSFKATFSNDGRFFYALYLNFKFVSLPLQIVFLLHEPLAKPEFIYARTTRLFH